MVVAATREVAKRSSHRPRRDLPAGSGFLVAAVSHEEGYMGKLDVSRRGFLKASAMAGLTVIIAPIGSRAFAALFEEKILTPLQWDAASGRASFRVDGIAKVTGAKVFARDMRAADMPHWPKQQSHAFMLRVTQADRVYQGFD